ncbi:hypothetical protein [Streptomyces sp. NPDC051994]|uniref:hypothetical protein n=1 Tax=unclassified Streptomyces TaxID=2593676 RepID=UPI003427AD69
MDERNLTSARPAADHVPLHIAAAHEPLRRVRGIPAAEQLRAVPDDDFRAATVTAYVQARSAGDWPAELRLIAAAARYDAAHPDEQPLFDELHAIEMFGTQYSEAA